MGTKAENSSFLKKLAENIKQVQDAREPEADSANEVCFLFKLSEEIDDALIFIKSSRFCEGLKLKSSLLQYYYGMHNIWN